MSSSNPQPRWLFPDLDEHAKVLYGGYRARVWGRDHIESELERLEPNKREYLRWQLNKLRIANKMKKQ